MASPDHRLGTLSSRPTATRRACQPLLKFMEGPLWARRQGSSKPCDFVFGNPHDPALPEMVKAIRQAALPERPDWFAYKLNEEGPRQAAAAALSARLGLDFAAEDFLLTKGAASGLAVVLQTILSPGEEVVYVTPPWFLYEAKIVFAGGTAVPVACKRSTFDLDVDAIADVITPTTRAVIVNSPNNPTGRVYPKTTLIRLAAVLAEASDRHGRPIYLISDEAYQRILFPGTVFSTPTAHYPHSFLVYSYGKTLLNPGQRLGYVALAPSMPPADAAELRSGLFLTQVASGAWFPDAVMQHALPHLEQLCIDLSRLCQRRDRLIGALTAAGYEVHVPEGTFYLLPQSPIPDDRAFAALLADEEVYVLPGSIVEMPGYFRLSLTADDGMVERALDGFVTARMRALSA